MKNRKIIKLIEGVKAQKKLNNIKRTLYTKRYNVIYDVDENIDSAIYTLERTNADKVSIRTLKKALKKLYKVRDIIES